MLNLVKIFSSDCGETNVWDLGMQRNLQTIRLSGGLDVRQQVLGKRLFQLLTIGALSAVVGFSATTAQAQDASSAPTVSSPAPQAGAEGGVAVPPPEATAGIPGAAGNLEGPINPNAPALQYLRNRGNVLRFMGRLHGLDAYFAEAANGSIQTFYVAPDGTAAIAGLMFNTQGQNITMGQVMSLMQNDPQALAAATRVQERAIAEDVPLRWF